MTMQPQPIVQVRVNPDHLAAVKEALAQIPGGFEQAMSRAINRTMNSGRVRISREIASKSRLKVRQINRGIHIDRASRDKLNGFIGLGRYRYPMEDFSPRFSRDNGVSVSILKGRRSFLPQAFKVEPRPDKSHRPAGYRGVGRDWWGYGRILMRRPTSGRLPFWDSGHMGTLVGRMPVMKVRGPSLVDLWHGAPQMVADVVRYSEQTLMKNVDQQVRYLIRPGKGKS